MDAKLEEITLGEIMCKKLKTIYFNEQKWIDCYKDVAYKFTQLKQIARNFYPDKSEIEILTNLTQYFDQDIQNALGESHGCEESPAKAL